MYLTSRLQINKCLIDSFYTVEIVANTAYRGYTWSFLQLHISIHMQFYIQAQIHVRGGWFARTGPLTCLSQFPIKCWIRSELCVPI